MILEDSIHSLKSFSTVLLILGRKQWKSKPLRTEIVEKQNTITQLQYSSALRMRPLIKERQNTVPSISSFSWVILFLATYTPSFDFL
jgi:hypothetical protein